MDIYFNDKFIDEFITNKSEVVVYGFYSCGYGDLRTALDNLRTPEQGKMLKTVHSCTLGMVSGDDPLPKIDDRNFYRIDYPVTRISQEKLWGRICKAGITNLIIENCRRELEGKPVIEMLFVIDKDRNKFTTTLPSLTEKKSGDKKTISYQELRRIYKHLNDSNDLISSVANKTFKFIKLVYPTDSMSFKLHSSDGKLNIHEDLAHFTYTPVAVNSPWFQEENEMKQLMMERNSSKIPKKKIWREQMLNTISSFNESSLIANLH